VSPWRLRRRVASHRPTGRQQENPNIAWEKVTFDKTLVDLEPEQVPRFAPR